MSLFCYFVNNNLIFYFNYNKIMIRLKITLTGLIRNSLLTFCFVCATIPDIGNEVLPWETKTAFMLMTSAKSAQKLSAFLFYRKLL